MVAEKKQENNSKTTKEEDTKKQLHTEKLDFTVDQELRMSLHEAKKLAEERLNELKYLHADFDNYRKQFEKEKCSIIKLANENLVKELIIILDDFDACLKAMEESKDKDGLVLLEKKFSKILEKHGLKCIESLGKEFNPHYHEVLCKEDSDKEEDCVLEEIQKGYTLDSKVIRATKVKVAKGLKKDKEDLNKEKEINKK